MKYNAFFFLLDLYKTLLCSQMVKLNTTPTQDPSSIPFSNNELLSLNVYTKMVSFPFLFQSFSFSKV